MKEVVVKYDSQENRCDILDPRDNGDGIGFYKEIVNSVGGMIVLSRACIEIFKFCMIGVFEG